MTTPFKWGAEFSVNTTTTGEQYTPAITALADGRFVVSWTDYSATGGDTSGSAIRAQMFNADGTALGGVFLVNTTKANNQGEPAITTLADGRFVVCWVDNSATGGDISESAVRARVFNANGTPSGAEFLVNTTTASHQFDPAITALDGGGFVVSWSDWSATGGDTSLYAVRAQVFNANGTSSGAEFLVNTTTASGQHQPAITALANGGFVVSWTDFSATGGDTSSNAVRAQVFNSNGTPSGAEFVVNTTTTDNQFEPAITTLADGRFVVSWTDNSVTGCDASASAVRGRVFDADGTPSGAEFLVNTTTASYQFVPAITALTDGRFVVCWLDASTTFNAVSVYSFRARVFSADGTASGAEFLVATTTISDGYQPAITSLADGRFVISWSEWNPTGGDISGPAVHAQIFDPREAAVTLNGTAADDSFFGTIFADHLAGSFGNDTLTGAAGDDRLKGEVGNDTLQGGQGNDTLLGGRDSDREFGGAGSDSLSGSLGSDVLNGGTGNDSLQGGTGKDWLTGGSGADRFIFASAAEAGTGAHRDRIGDFAAGSDKLDFTAFMAGGHFIGGAAYSPGNGPQVRFVTATGILSGDVDGNGTVDFQLKLDGAPVLSAADFLF